MRLSILGVVALLLMGALGTRLWFLQMVDSKGLDQRVETLRTRVVRLAPERGRIFDSRGRILADNDARQPARFTFQPISRKSVSLTSN